MTQQIVCLGLTLVGLGACAGDDDGYICGHAYSDGPGGRLCGDLGGPVRHAFVVVSEDADSAGLVGAVEFLVQEYCPGPSYQPLDWGHGSFEEGGEACAVEQGYVGGDLDSVGTDSSLDILAWVQTNGAPFTSDTPAGLLGQVTDDAVVNECLAYEGYDGFDDRYRGRTSLEQGFIGVHALDLDAGLATLEVHLPGMAGKLSAVVCDGDQGVWWKDRTE